MAPKAELIKPSQAFRDMAFQIAITKRGENFIEEKPKKMTASSARMNSRNTAHAPTSRAPKRQFPALIQRERLHLSGVAHAVQIKKCPATARQK